MPNTWWFLNVSQLSEVLTEGTNSKVVHSFPGQLANWIGTALSQTTLGALMPAALTDLSTFKYLNYIDDFPHLKYLFNKQPVSIKRPFLHTSVISDPKTWRQRTGWKTIWKKVLKTLPNLSHQVQNEGSSLPLFGGRRDRKAGKQVYMRKLCRKNRKIIWDATLNIV